MKAVILQYTLYLALISVFGWFLFEFYQITGVALSYRGEYRYWRRKLLYNSIAWLGYPYGVPAFCALVLALFNSLNPIFSFARNSAFTAVFQQLFLVISGLVFGFSVIVLIFKRISSAEVRITAWRALFFSGLSFVLEIIYLVKLFIK